MTGQGWVMGSKNMLKSTSFAIPLAPSSHGRLFHTHRLLFSAHSSKPISRVLPFSLKTNGFSSMPHADAPSPGISHLRHMRMSLWIIYIGGLVRCYFFAKIISGFIKHFC